MCIFGDVEFSMNVKGIYRREVNKIQDVEVVLKEKNWENSKIKFFLFVILFRFFMEIVNICIYLNIILLLLFIISEVGGRGGWEEIWLEFVCCLRLCEVYKFLEGNKVFFLMELNYVYFCKRFLVFFGFLFKVLFVGIVF